MALRSADMTGSEAAAALTFSSVESTAAGCCTRDDADNSEAGRESRKSLSSVETASVIVARVRDTHRKSCVLMKAVMGRERSERNRFFVELTLMIAFETVDDSEEPHSLGNGAYRLERRGIVEFGADEPFVERALVWAEPNASLFLRNDDDTMNPRCHLVKLDLADDALSNLGGELFSKREFERL